MSVSLRAPVAADYVLLASWIPSPSACARWAGPNLRFPFAEDELPRLLEVRGGHDGALVGADGALVGFGQYWPRDEHTVHLGRIIVSPAERGRGRGRALVHALIDEAIRQFHPRRITLKVYRDNAPARSLYTGLGFVEIDAESSAEVLGMELKVPSNPGAPRS